MTGFLSKACQLAVFGGIGGMFKYHFTYKTMRTDLEHNSSAINTFSHDIHREIYDVIVVGGGIVGVATTREICRQFPKKRVLLLEKEADVAQHQSGHNSGVIHAGMYYKPGSMMSRLCPRGHGLMVDYCRRNKLPLDMVGKIIVGTTEADIPAIEQLYEWGTANGVKGLELLLGQEAIANLEPNVRGVIALHSPNTGIADFAAVTRHLFKELSSKNSSQFNAAFNFNVQALSTLKVAANESNLDKNVDSLVMIRGRETGQLGPEKVVIARHVITCCGLSNDVIAKQSGAVLWNSGAQPVSHTFGFRGRYYQLKPHARSMVKRNVYPAPEPAKGFAIGIHFTPTVDERRGHNVIIGPGSALATARYGYTPLDVDVDYCLGALLCSSGWKCLIANCTSFFEAMATDLSRARFLKNAQVLIPSVKDEDIEESFCGVMGLAIGQGGKLETDLALELARPAALQWVRINRNLILEQTGSIVEKLAEETKEKPLVLNVRNAPSPAATSSLAIAEEIVSTAKRSFQW